MTEKQLKFTLVLVSAFAASVLVFMLIRKNRQTQKANERDEKKILNDFEFMELNGIYDNPDSLAAINHNPTNIIKSSAQWEGKTLTPLKIIVEGRNTRFEAFENDYFGIRAALLNLKNGYFNKGKNTLEKIISKWAPATENNTTNYINTAVKLTDWDKDKVINEKNNAEMFILLKTIAKIDGGFNGDKIIKQVVEENN